MAEEEAAYRESIKYVSSFFDFNIPLVYYSHIALSLTHTHTQHQPCLLRRPHGHCHGDGREWACGRRLGVHVQGIRGSPKIL